MINEELHSEKHKNASWKKVLTTIIAVVTILVLIIGAVRFLHFFKNRNIEIIEMSGISMLPSISDGDMIRVDTAYYSNNPVERFDVVVFLFETYSEDVPFIKRVIGMPGETIEISDGVIFINGEELKEYYGLEAIENGWHASEPVLIMENEYFVLGDNRNNSLDSRRSEVGNIGKSRLIGKVIGIQEEE